MQADIYSYMKNTEWKKEVSWRNDSAYETFFFVDSYY